MRTKRDILLAEPLSDLDRARNLDQAGNWEEALPAYENFLKAHPDSLDGLVDYAGLLMVLGRLDEAGKACARALQIDPQHYGASVHAACVLMHLGDLDGSETLFRGAIATDPKRVAGRLMLADCLARKGDLGQARALLEQALGQDPKSAIILDRINTIMARQGDWDGLRKNMERQLVRYSGAEAEYVASHLDLLFGDMPLGWQKFESRLQIPNRFAQREYSQPLWQGEPFTGKTLLLTWEQGFGDTLMFLRFVPLAKRLGGRVLVEVQPQLIELATTCLGIDGVISPVEPLPSFDLHASLLSLPALLGTTLASIPAEIPYLDIPKQVPDRANIAEILNATSGQVRVGVCWSGNSKYPRDAKRSMPAATLAPLAAFPNIAWYSLQFEAADEAPLPGIKTLGPLLRGFPNTACVLDGMDLVITVDTVLAHLSGALGIPTFLLLSFIPDWRWMMGRVDSPWYPTVRLYRQPSPGDWESVIRDVIRDLSVSD